MPKEYIIRLTKQEIELLIDDIHKASIYDSVNDQRSSSTSCYDRRNLVVKMRDAMNNENQ